MLRRVLPFSWLLICACTSFAQRYDVFSRADSVANQFSDFPLTNLLQLSNKLTKPLSTEEEKFRAIYRWVCLNIAFDNDLFLLRQQRDKIRDSVKLKTWNQSFNNRVSLTLVKDHRSVCTGYAWLVQKLALFAGITCVIVDGYGQTWKTSSRHKTPPNHSWIAVKLNGQWRLCDPTWSSGYQDNISNCFVAQYNDSYFLTDPAVFARNHYPLNPKWLLTNSSQTLDKFLESPIVYRKAIALGLVRVFPESFEINTKAGRAVDFSMTRSNGGPIEELEFDIRKNDRGMLTKSITKRDSLGDYHASYCFKKKGDFIMHVMIEKEYVLTYHVTVQ